jgi:hypothetical protein
MDETLKIDLTDIDFSTIDKYLTVDVKLVSDILKQLNSIINLKGSRLARGITIKVWDRDTIFIVCPNELYFFKAELHCTTTFDSDTYIYIDYNTIQKLLRFVNTDFYIFKMNDKYYLRLTTGNLELISPDLDNDEKKKVDYKFNIKDNKYSFNTEELHVLESLYSITDFEIEQNKRWVTVKNNIATFKSPLLMAKANFDFINVKIEYKILNYLLYLCNNAYQGTFIDIYEVESSIIPKYAICYNNTMLISSYARSTEDTKILNLFEDLPKFTIIDYSDLKYKLEYADSITYAKNVVTFINRDDKLIGKIKLQNNSETEVEIPVLGEMCLKRSEQIKVNFKTLLIALNALNADPSLETYFGLKNGLLYLINSDVSLALVTF